MIQNKKAISNMLFIICACVFSQISSVTALPFDNSNKEMALKDSNNLLTKPAEPKTPNNYYELLRIRSNNPENQPDDITFNGKDLMTENVAKRFLPIFSYMGLQPLMKTTSNNPHSTNFYMRHLLYSIKDSEFSWEKQEAFRERRHLHVCDL